MSTARGELHTGKAAYVVDEAFEHSEASGAAYDVGVHGEHEGASVVVGSLESGGPDVVDVSWARHRRPGAERRRVGEVGRVVQLPVDGDLDDRAVVHGHHVRNVVAHEAGVVGEAAVGEKLPASAR